MRFKVRFAGTFLPAFFYVFVHRHPFFSKRDWYTSIMQNKTIIIVCLAFIIGFFMGYMLRPSLDTEGQSAAVQKTVPITAPLQITATPVYTYNQPTTLTWSSPAHLNLTNCQGTSTDISGNTIPTSWNGAHGSLNITNSFQATMNVPVPINKVVFK